MPHDHNVIHHLTEKSSHGIQKRKPVTPNLGFAGIKQRWLELASLDGMKVSIESPCGGIEEVTVVGYGQHGELMVMDKNSIVKPVWTADINRI